MSEVKKVTEQELQAIQTLQQDYATVTFQLGQNTVEINTTQKELAELELTKESLFKNLAGLKERESKLSSDLEKKYGTTTIDLESGIIQA